MRACRTVTAQGEVSKPVPRLVLRNQQSCRAQQAAANLNPVEAATEKLRILARKLQTNQDFGRVFYERNPGGSLRIHFGGRRK